jgi:hypothetical protein
MLIDVADGAYPQNDYSFLPESVVVWAGYVGGHTPHAWSKAEVAALKATGRAWWGIWTAPERALTAADGDTEGIAAAAEYETLGYPKDDPVFLDVEYYAYHANPDGAIACFRAWAGHMWAAGYTRTHWYSDDSSPADWIAVPIQAKPTALPPGVVGVQYQRGLSNDRYDLSVFDSSLLVNPGSVMTQPQVDALNAKLDTLLARTQPFDPTHPNVATLGTIVQRLTAIRDGDPGHADLADVVADLDQLHAQMSALTPGVTPPAPTYTATITLTPQP